MSNTPLSQDSATAALRISSLPHPDLLIGPIRQELLRDGVLAGTPPRKRGLIRFRQCPAPVSRARLHRSAP